MAELSSPRVKDSLTSLEYWSKYYHESNEEKDVIHRVCSKYDFFFDLLVSRCSKKPTSIVEIGAFPGRYLAYLGNKFDLKVTGVDFNPDFQKFERVLQNWNVQGNYLITDFTKFDPIDCYDLVFSNGFIEHFSDYDAMMDRHANLVCEGGGLMIMIPNKRFLRAVYGNIVDRQNQQAHNLDCMNLAVFRRFAERHNFVVSYLGYFGGFPYKVHQPLNFWQKLVYHPVRFFSVKFRGLLARYPNRFVSGTIVGVFHKPVK